MDKVLFHSLETQRLQFKKLEMDDCQAIHAYASNPDVSRFIGWSLMQTYEDTEAFVAKMMQNETSGTHIYANVVDKASGKIIGTVMFFNMDTVANKAELGYVFHQDTWGQGYCTEAVEAICDFAFKVIGLHKIHAQVTDTNIGSSRVLEKNGFVQEGRLKDHYFIEGYYYDCLLYGKL